MIFKLKAIRQENKLTQEELAEKSGVGRVTICRLETGELKETTTGTLSKLARALNVSIDQLIEEWFFIPLEYSQLYVFKKNKRKRKCKGKSTGSNCKQVIWRKKHERLLLDRISIVQDW